MKTHASLPIRLHASARPAVEAHFLSLDAEDRRLRFGAAIGDEVVRDYVKRIDFERDEIFAATAGDLRLLGVVHVAFGGPAAELGLSVLPRARGRGVGSALFERAVIHLRNRGARSVFVHCLAENQAMMHLARKHEMRVVYAGGESEAFLEIEAPTPESFVVEWIRDHHANAFESAKRNAHYTRRFFRLFAPG